MTSWTRFYKRGVPHSLPPPFFENRRAQSWRSNQSGQRETRRVTTGRHLDNVWWTDRQGSTMGSGIASSTSLCRVPLVPISSSVVHRMHGQWANSSSALQYNTYHRINQWTKYQADWLKHLNHAFVSCLEEGLFFSASTKAHSRRTLPLPLPLPLPFLYIYYYT